MTSQNREFGFNLFSNRLTKFHDLLLKITKIACLVGSGCGFAYLWAFTREAGIPMPLELSVLPAALLMIGLVSVVATFIIMFGMVLPAVMNDELNKVTKGFLNADDCIEHIVQAKFQRYAVYVWLPTALSLTGILLFFDVFTKEIWKNYLASASMLLAVGWIIYTPRFVGKFEENRWEYCFTMSYHVALAVWAYALMILFSLIIFPEMASWHPIVTASLILIVFTLIHAVISVPLQKTGNRNRLLPPFRRTTIPPLQIGLLIAAMATAASVIMPQMNSKIGGAVLRVFNIVGGIPIAICTKTMPPARIARTFNFGLDQCSEKVEMLFDSGDRIYVKKIDAKKIIRSETVYFRQDEVLQKIFYKDVKTSSK